MDVIKIVTPEGKDGRRGMPRLDVSGADGVDIRDYRIASLRRMIGVVNQDAIMFNETIAANIAYGKPDASMDEIVAAAKLANAHDFIVIGSPSTSIASSSVTCIEASLTTAPLTLTLPWEIFERTWDLVPMPLFASNLSSLMRLL